MSYFSLQQISITLGHFQLKRISFSLESKQTLVILGPSGSGKTALLETIAGFNLAKEGKIELDGEDITKAPTEKRKMGYVFQNYALFPNLTVEQNVAFGLRQSANRQQRTLEMLDFLGIRNLAKRKTGKLSGGEKQRVALARALARNPKLFLFDEPLSAVDAAAREGLRDELHLFLRNLNATSLYVTHDRTEALVLADILAVIKNGEIQQIGNANEVFTYPNDSWVAKFLGMQVLRPEWVEFLDKGHAMVGIGGAKLLTQVRNNDASKWVVVFHPDDAQVIKHSKELKDGSEVVSLIIDKITPLGPFVRVELKGTVLFTSLLLRRQYSELGLNPGDAADIHFDAGSLQLVPEAKEDVSNPELKSSQL